MTRSLAAAALAAAGLIATAPALAADAAPYGKAQGLVPGVLLGPKVSLLALPPGFGLDLKTFDNALGLSLDLGILPTVTVAGASASWTDFSVSARWFPWAARFFLGARLGTRSFSASAEDSSTGLTAKAEVSSAYVAPELGWTFVWQAGFFMGVELGYQLVLTSKTTLDIPGGIDLTKQKDVQDAADQVGKIGLPVLTLLQVGYLF